MILHSTHPWESIFKFHVSETATHTQAHVRAHGCKHTSHLQRNIRTLTPTRTHSLTQSHTHKLTHTHTHARTHSRTHARTHARTQTHTHTHTHTHGKTSACNITLYVVYLVLPTTLNCNNTYKHVANLSQQGAHISSPGRPTFVRVVFTCRGRHIYTRILKIRWLELKPERK